MFVRPCVRLSVCHTGIYRNNFTELIIKQIALDCSLERDSSLRTPNMDGY